MIRWRGPGVLVVVVLLAGLVVTAGRAAAAPAPVPLGAAASFSLLSGFGVTNTGATDVSADVGANTAISVVGFPPGVVRGAMHVGDPTSTQALTDLALAYADAAGRTADAGLAGDLIGRTFAPGVYHADAAVALTGTVTLDGGGDPNAVFIFQLGAAFDTAASTNVNLINGASPSRVYWQVVGATGIGALASFSGTILTTAAITVGAGARLTGQALSTAGAITLSANTVMTPPIVTITGGASMPTDDATPTIAGTSDAAAGTTVTVTIAGQTLTTTLAAGAWSVTAAPIPNGSFLVTASVTGPAGNTSTARQVLMIGGTTPVALGAASTFSLLSGAGVTNTGVTDVSADLGANTAISVVGFPPGVVHGVVHVGDTTSAQALADLVLAYDDAAARTPDVEIAGDLNGRTLTPGVYHATAAVGLTGTLTLDGGGDPDAVFIFQLGAAFNTAASSIVNLTNGASSAHVYWQVVGATVIGADASFSGTVLTTAAITIGARATFTGQALATTGAITISANTITTPGAAPGALSINVPTGVVDLGRYPNQPGGLTVGGPLGPVQVDDTRGGTATSGWTVTVSATAFTPASGPAIPATAISYSP
ncbi:MAG: ice-binding family protein, partial [Ilumatobacteraceae bacterium]